RVLVDELGIEPSTELRELERAILRHDPALDVEAPAHARARQPERAILVAITGETRIDALLEVAEPLVRSPARTMILAMLLSDAAELRPASAWLQQHRWAPEAGGGTTPAPPVPPRAPPNAPSPPAPQTPPRLPT